ncbi:hypothetical protein QM996_13855 [Sinorhizobium chiapasense]
MPRTGGVYSPPAGTKGTPNTTIQSVPYNTWVDDLTADANAARPITAGGTGATSASAARTALGVAIGSDVQAYDAGLQSIAGLTTAADRMIYTTASDVYATTALTPFARTLLDDADASTVLSTLGVSTFMKTVIDDADAATARATLGLTIGTNVQAYDAGLQSIAGLTTAANQMIYTTALDAYATTALTAFARTILDDADAATVRATIGANDASNLTAGTVADARLPTSMAGKTFTTAVTMGDGDLGDGETILTLASDRPWTIRQRGETATANLSFENITSKQIGFSSDPTYAGPVILMNPVTTDPFISIGGDRVVTVAGASFTGAINNTGMYTYNGNGEAFRIAATNTTSDPFFTFYKLAVRQGYIQHTDGAGTGVGFKLVNEAGGTTNQLILTNDAGTDGLRYTIGASNYEVWHSGNDGSGSGLDADLLDGLNAATANTVSTIVARDGSGDIQARLLRSEYTSTSSTCVAFMGQEVIGGVGTNNYVRPMTIAQAAALLDSSLVPVGRTVIAGNGMTGGGALSANITLTMGTPSNITNSTTNSVTSTSHTHALGFVAAEVYQGTGANDTSFPLGHIVLAQRDAIAAPDRNSAPGVYLNGGVSTRYSLATGGTALSGTWRSRGSAEGSAPFTILQRTA